MIVGLPGLVGSHGFPAAGTWLSSVCSGPSAHDSGNSTYYDSHGTNFNGMFTLWQQFADGFGGSYWTSYGNNSNDGHTACWYPLYFYINSGGSDQGFDWYGCGTSGHFVYGSYQFYSYWNGDGTTTDYDGINYYYSAGYLIYDSGCCQVYYDGSSGYYVSDNCGGGGGCPPAGNNLGPGCQSTSGYDASGWYWEGSWFYGTFYADGSCGQYFVYDSDNYNGCWYPNGYWFSYTSDSSVLNWEVNDSCPNLVANGSFTFGTSYSGTKANGTGGSDFESGSWSAATDDLIASGTYYDSCADINYNYEVRYNGSGGYYVTLS